MENKNSNNSNSTDLSGGYTKQIDHESEPNGKSISSIELESASTELAKMKQPKIQRLALSSKKLTTYASRLHNLEQDKQIPLIKTPKSWQQTLKKQNKTTNQLEKSFNAKNLETIQTSENQTFNFEKFDKIFKEKEQLIKKLLNEFSQNNGTLKEEEQKEYISFLEFMKESSDKLKKDVKNNSSLIMSIRLLIEEDFSNIKPGMEEVAKKRAINGLEIVAKDKERFQERSQSAADIQHLYILKNKVKPINDKYPNLYKEVMNKGVPQRNQNTINISRNF